ncbi:hypothetical protein [Sorangium sp. So ce1151]|uniref:hypothetical protein n=1 Tax=Sorangium sp. So ce1151 TaxID=3133332 RepID=UPI003F5F9346
MSTANRLLCSAFLIFASTLPVACGHDAGPPPAAPASAPDERAHGRVGAWARRLEADPHPPGEEEESARLFTWLVNAPDVTVTVCDEVISA